MKPPKMVRMSALGHKQTFAVQNGMSALHPKADMCAATKDVRYVPKADIGRYRNEMTSPLSSAATSARSGGPTAQHRAVLLVSTPAWARCHCRDQIVTSLTSA
jgi:hypothetical protein